MSYGAALRLDMISTGTARVDVRVIDVSAEPEAQAIAYTGVADDAGSEDNHETWLQAGAYGRLDGAEQLAGQLEQADVSPVTIHNSGDLFRVWLGPYLSSIELESVIARVIELGFERPHKVRR